MKNLITYTLIILLTGCSSIHIPPSPNIPLLTQGGETSVSVQASTNSFELAGGQAISDKYALIYGGAVSYGNLFSNYDLVGFMDNNNEEMWRNNYPAKHYNFELGFGHYRSFGNKLLEFYGGGGYGYGKSFPAFHENKYSSLFLQVNYGIKKRKFQLGLTTKFTGLYQNFTIQMSPDQNYEGRLSSNISALDVQPGIVLRFGEEDFKMQFCAAANVKQTLSAINQEELYFHPESNYWESYTIIHLSVGINLNFNNRYTN